MELKVNLTISNYNDLALLDEVLKRVKGNVNVDVEVVDPKQSVQQPVQNIHQPIAVPTQSAVVQAQNIQAPVQQPAVAPTQSVPVQAPVNNVATYTIADLQKAASPLAQAGRMPELQGLLQSFNVVSMIDLPKEHYGAFALKLRELGAAI